MRQDRLFRRFSGALAAPAVFLTIFAVGLQYAYYSIFSLFHFYDDEGTMMLRVAMLIRDPASYDSLSGVYGPFYYLHKYALHAWLNLPVSHDVNRLTTIVLWGFTAAACAVFVYRLSRSVVLAAIVQMQLILHLRAFVNEPGHPQEIAMALVAGALMSASFVTDRRIRWLGMAGLGTAIGALLLVKINLGAYLAIAVALALLFSIPRSSLVTVLRWITAIVAMLLPAAVIWRHIHLPWARNYCALVTLALGANLLVAARRTVGEELRWKEVAVAAGAAIFTMVCVCAIVLAWGNPPSAILNSVLLRPATFSSTFVIPAPIGQDVVTASLVSVLLAGCYALAARRIQGRDAATLTLACIKLLYACFAFYNLYALGPGVLRLAIPVPFLWLLLIRTETAQEDRGFFPRALLCLVAAFETLQAYPVHGSQATWAVFLVAPVAAICGGDALHAIWNAAERRLGQHSALRRPPWLPATISLLVLICACAGYYRKADIAGLESVYRQQAPLALPGAGRLRLPAGDVAQIQWLVTSVRSHCDGFVGMPGFGSLYFWTGIEPPASMNGAWILNLESTFQRAVVEKMRTYERPCVVQNPGMVGFWTGGRALDPEQPLVKYIREQFKPGPHFGAYTILLSSRVR